MEQIGEPNDSSADDVHKTKGDETADTEQIGEPNASAADNVLKTSAVPMNGEKQKCESDDKDVVKISSDEDEDTERDTVEEEDTDSDSSDGVGNFLDYVFGMPRMPNLGEKPKRESNDNNDVKISSDEDEDTEPDTVDEDAKDSSSSEDDDDFLDYVLGVPKRVLGLAKLARRIGAPIGPSFPVPSAQFENDVLQAFKKEKARIKGALAQLDSKICLSIDKICDIYSYDNYLQLSAHFIDEKWKLKKWVLKFCSVYSFACEEFDDAVLDALKDWGIEEKVFSFTIVGASSGLNRELVETFKDFVEEKKKVQLDGKLFGVDCCARICILLAKDAYKEISDVIRKIQWLISWKFPPFWFLPAFMLKKALELESKGEFSKENNGDDHDVPSVEEWEKARFVSDLVIGLHKIVRTLFDTKYPTANNFLHKLQEVRAMLFKEASSADKFKSKTGKKMLERLDGYWEEMSLTLAIASVMDPRFKMRYLDYLSSKGEISGNKLETSVILDAIHSLYGDYATQDVKREYPVSDDSTSSESESEDELPKTPAGEERSDSVLVQEYIQFIGTINQSQKSDLDRYLEDPVVSWSQDFNVLSWWRVEGAKYPTLSKMARDILAIPMSVATSPEVYLKERDADPHICSSGTDEIKNARICLPSWGVKQQN